MKQNNKSVKIIPLGGLEQIGMNITAFEYEDSIIVVDCGLAFPEDEMLGIDLVIPDVTYLKENADKVKGLVITHGHEDHIGAIPYIENEVNMPIYATKLTMGLIEHKLREHGNINNVRRKIVTHGQMITLGAFRIEFIRTTHSIADAAALAIYTPAGIIVHTGDFKVDYTPVFGEAIDLPRFGELGKKGVLALMRILQMWSVPDIHHLRRQSAKCLIICLMITKTIGSSLRHLHRMLIVYSRLLTLPISMAERLLLRDEAW